MSPLAASNRLLLQERKGYEIGVGSSVAAAEPRDFGADGRTLGEGRAGPPQQSFNPAQVFLRSCCGGFGVQRSVRRE